MITEMQRKMGGWIHEAIAPALIMLMTGSLVFFMVEVFYFGSYVGRVKWVLGLFVFASVLISRISIEEGFEKATLYGVFLGGATIFVLTTLSSFPLLLAILFIGVIWWFNSKLTWDCTVIDTSRDSTDRGLMERMGLDPDSEVSAETEEEAPEEIEAEGTSDKEDRKKPDWATRFFSRKKKPNTPGAWVLYFSLAAIPIYGFGQAWIEEAERRQNAFFDFCLYLTGGLGLLITTALIGLQRYLQKRNATMPNSVAITWVTAGIVMVGGILFAAWLLPRPYSEYSFAENPFKYTQKSDWGSSRNSFGNEGKDDGDSGGVRDDQSENDSGSGGKKKGPPTDGDGKQNKKGGGNRSTDSKSGRRKENGKPGDRSKKTDSDKSGKGGKKQDSKGKSPQPGNLKDDSGNGKKKQNPSQEGPKGNQKERAPSERNPNNEKNGNEKNGNEKNGNEKESTEQKKKGSPSSGGGRSPKEEKGKERQESKFKDQKRRGGAGKQDEDSNNQKDRSSQTNQSSKNSSSTSSWKLPSLGNLAWILQWLLIIGGIILAIVLLVRNRKQFAESFRRFLRNMKEFWARLFGWKRTRNSHLQFADEHHEPLTPSRAFHEYPNPFVTGLANQMSHKQLILISYDALQAWAREHQVEVSDEQTPHEFAVALAQVNMPVAKSAKKLADHYCSLAFSNGATADPGTVQDLAQLWQSMDGGGQLAVPIPRPI